MSVRLFINFFLIFSLGSIDGFSQQIKVQDSKTKKGIENVFIYNINQTVNEITDTKGGVDLSKFSEKDTLIFSHQSYDRFVIQKKDIRGSIQLKERAVSIPMMEITAKKIKEKALEETSNIDRIDLKTVQMNNPQTAAEMLELSGGVFIQKSQGGGGSPVIRGFEANRVLLVVDGVRLNNAIYRSGHLQNAITVDNAILEKTDVIYGANSVIYGSDAVGGVVHYQTKTPIFRGKEDTVNNYTANAYTRYSTANQEKTAHLDFNLGFKKIAAVSSITFSDFDDLTQGKKANSDYPDFGIFEDYAGRINNVDTALQKSDLSKQIGTGYRQTDLLQKISYQLTKDISIHLNAQYSTSSNISRYDQLTEYDDGELRWAQWDYGPQNRLLTALSTKVKSNNQWFDQAELLFSYQKIDEDRITRRFNSVNLTTREEDVNVYGVNLDFFKMNENRSKWFYGFELLHNTVNSSAISENIFTGEQAVESTRYPDDGSSLGTAAAYVSYKNNFSEKATYSFGTRYSYSSLKVNFSDTTFITLPFEKATLNNGALTGNVGLAYHPNKKWKINMAIATAFRSPNVDDVGKVFSSSGQFVIVPNDNLKPEYTYNGELGITRSFFNDKLKLNAVGYYTFLNNAIVRDFFQLNGLDSLEYEGEVLRVQANVNTSEAFIYGASLRAFAQVTDKINLKSSLNYTVGENTTENIPLGHIPPLYGRTDLTLNTGLLTVSIYAKYQGWKRIEDFSPSGVDNEDKATADGTPAWQTFNISSSMKIAQNFTIQAALENILDTHYRPFSSGVSGAGRNFIFTLRANI